MSEASTCCQKPRGMPVILSHRSDPSETARCQPWRGFLDVSGSSQVPVAYGGLVPSLNDVVKAYTDLEGDDVDVAAPAGRRLADHRRPLLRRPGALAARPGGPRVLGAVPRCGRRPARRPSSTTWSGAFVPRGRRPLLDAAYDEGRIAREGDPEWRDDVPVRVETIPVVRDGEMLARDRP